MSTESTAESAKRKLQIIPFIAYALTTIGIGWNLQLLVMPATGGNGFTTLPLLIFLLLATAPAPIRDSIGRTPRWLMALLRNRRPFGICAGLWALSHALTKGAFSLAIQPEGLLHHMARPDVLIGVVALAMTTALLVTSNDASMRMMKRGWKRLHQLIWLVPGLALAHGYAVSTAYAHDGGLITLPMIVAMIVFAVPLVTWLIIGAERRQRHRAILPIAALLVASAILFALGPLPDAAIKSD